MATAVADDQAGQAEPPRPYGPSWVDGLKRLVERLPGSLWMSYLAIAAAGTVAINGILWLSGTVVSGPDAYQATESFLFGLAGLALIHYLDHIASARLDDFAPALGVEAATLDRFRYELTVLPARPAVAAAIIGVVAVFASFQADTAAAEFAKLPIAAQILGSIVELATIALGGVLVYHTIRQLRLVSRIHGRAGRIDLFTPGPLHAFSGLTARTGLGLIAVAGATLLLPGASAYVSTWIIVGILMGSAVVVFIVPLRGMQLRMSAEKERLRTDADHRLRATLELLDRRADAVDLADADALNKTLASQLLQREVLARLPTWPWTTGTIRGFASALLLPLLLWAVQRALERLV